MVRLRGLYTLGGAVMAVTAGSPDGSVLAGVFSALLFAMWIAAGGHALAIGRWVFDLPRPGARSLSEQQRAVLAARAEEDSARQEVLRIVRQDPDLAASLNIGRVDMTDRAFPDGGLIDVNNVRVDALRQATRLPHDVCTRIIEMRQALGGFQSAAVMSVALDLPPHLLDKIAGRIRIPSPGPGGDIAADSARRCSDPCGTWLYVEARPETPHAAMCVDPENVPVGYFAP